jgi:tRNA A37 methylthiotransferase MiaB
MKKDFVSPSVIKGRSTKAAQLAKHVALDRNRRWVGWIGEILVDEIGKIPGSWIGRNFAYKPVTVKSAEYLLGKTVRVRVAEAFAPHLKGEVVE